MVFLLLQVFVESLGTVFVISLGILEPFLLTHLACFICSYLLVQHLKLQTSSFPFDFHKVISCYYRLICLVFKTYQTYLRYINLCGFQVVPSNSCHWLRERGVVYCFVLDTRHTPLYVPLTSISFTEQNTPHTENRSLVTIRALLSRLCRLTHVFLCSMYLLDQRWDLLSLIITSFIFSYYSLFIILFYLILILVLIKRVTINR